MSVLVLPHFLLEEMHKHRRVVRKEKPAGLELETPGVHTDLPALVLRRAQK